jgi:transcriptional regulator with XRE-family HTH domain
MKEINIAKTLINKRKEKGITQDDLANFIGVSKASVSKWKTDQSYPDIVFIPQLAAYFNISIDELMGYEPQMEIDDIHKLIKNLTGDFAAKPFDDVVENCNEIIKKYYSCFPLLLHMAALFISHCALLGDDAGKAAALMAQSKELCVKVKNESDDVWLKKQALHLEAACALGLDNPTEVLELMNGTNEPFLSTDELLAAAYQMSGDMDKAKEVVQISVFKHVLALVKSLSLILVFYADDAERFEQVYDCAVAVTNAFDVKVINPYGLLGIYATAAQGFTANGNTEKALDNLQKYTDMVTSGMYSVKPKGSAFFDLVDDWINLPELNVTLALDDKAMKQALAGAVIDNPAFASLKENSRFISITDKLRNNIEG